MVLQKHAILAMMIQALETNAEMGVKAPFNKRQGSSFCRQNCLISLSSVANAAWCQHVTVSSNIHTLVLLWRVLNGMER